MPGDPQPGPVHTVRLNQCFTPTNGKTSNEGGSRQQDQTRPDSRKDGQTGERTHTQTEKQTKNVLQTRDGAVDRKDDDTIEDNEDRHAIITVFHMLDTRTTDADTFNTLHIPTYIKPIPSVTTGRHTCPLFRHDITAPHYRPVHRTHFSWRLERTGGDVGG